MFATAWDDGLDESQLAAVTHGDSPLVVVAGAGTGKTRTLTARVARLLERGVPPERILLLTFTRRAADDMLARAAAMTGHAELSRRLRGGTFHAVAHQFVAAFAGLLGLVGGFSVLDASDSADVMDLLRDEHGLAGREQRAPRASTLAELYSRCVNTRRTVAEVIASDYPWCEPHVEAVGKLCRAYVARKRAHQQVDFDDLLLYWRALLDERLGTGIAQMFDHVLVDEYQDVNPLQVDIVTRLRPDGRGLTVVGDDAQAIYGFRGADAAHLHEMSSAFADCAVVRLERNFRSFQPILDLANRIRPDGGEAMGAPAASGRRGEPVTGRRSEPVTGALVLRASREGGQRPSLLRCHDAASEARAIVDAILERHEPGRRLAEQAVLVRAAHHSDLIELELTARRVPFRKYGGLRFLESAHVKDFAATLRLLDNPTDDVAWFRLLRLHDGIGPARARQLLETLPPRRPTAVWQWAETAAAAPPACRVAVSDSLAALDAARGLTSAGERALAVLRLLRPLVTARYAEAAARLGDLEQLAAAAATRPDLASWLAEITLDPPASTSEVAGPPHLDEDYVVVSTVHSAKGLEWPVVHLPHLVDGAFPSDMALRSPRGLEEERRLFYVACTRARDELLLYSPLRMPHHRHAGDDRHSFAQRTRWLDASVMAVLRVEDEPPPRLAAAAPGVPSAADDRVRAGIAAELDLEALWR